MCTCIDSPSTFRCGFPLNSTDFLRPKKIKSVGNSVYDLFRPEGMPDRLAPSEVYLSKLGRTIRPRVHCHHHQNPKAGNALTISPFLVDDDNHMICTGGLENIDGLPLHVSTIFNLPLECKMLTLGSMLPLDFIDQLMTANELNRQQACICRNKK